MGREFELKYRADAEQLAAIGKAYSGFSPIRMETTYYDTPDRDMGERHWTLPRRYENGVSVCTVKIPGEGSSCGEWETEAADIFSALPDLLAAGAPEELEALSRKGLAPVCGARFIRMACHLSLEGCTVELALDSGCLMGGGQELPFAEVEVELKSGSESAAVAFAQNLAEEFGLVSESRSKVQRALELAKR